MHGNECIDNNPEDLWGIGSSPLIDPRLLTDDNASGPNGEKKLNKTNAPLKSLRPSTVRSLATLLNPTKIIPTENGLLR